MTEPLLSLASLPPAMIEAIRRDAEHFPAFVRNRGREYLVGGRVGPFEIDDHVVRASVRGTHTYRTAWRWNGQSADPTCTCPVAPLCKHAYALARAIVMAHDGDDSSTATIQAYAGRHGSSREGSAPSGTAPVQRADSEVEALRRAPVWDRNRLFARLVAVQYTHGIYLTAHDFRSTLEDPDPDLMCWRLANEIPKHAGGWLPRGLMMYRDRPDLAARAEERTQTEMTEGLAQWARTHAAPTSRSLRVVFGLERSEDGEPRITMQARATTPRLRDEPRSAQQLIQLGTELRRDVTLLAPPHARLLRVLVGGYLQTARYLDSHSFELGAGALNRLLDSLSDSPLATWGDAIDPVLRTRGGIVPGGRIRLEDGALDVLPMCVNDGGGMRVALAARWPDGTHRLLDTLVYASADDDLHPSLVLADGGFWRVGEEPPRDLLRRFAVNGSLPVPDEGRERFLELLASSFASVAEALAPHTRLHIARPAVAFDLREDDWLQVRLFAHTGAADWRPGGADAGVIVFEYGPEGRWFQLGTPAAEAREAEGGLEGLTTSGATASHAEIVPDDAQALTATSDGAVAAGAVFTTDGSIATAPAVAPAPVADPALTPAATENPADIWLEAPDPSRVEPVREWLVSLPVSRGDVRTTGSAALEAEDAAIGWWLRLNPKNLESFAEGWERRPDHVAWLGNRRMRELLGGTRQIRPRVRVTASGVDWFAVSAEWEAEGLSITDADLAKLRGARTRFVKLSSGWVRRELADDFDRAAGLLADLGVEAGAGEQKVTTWQLAQAKPEHLAALMDLGADPRAARDIERLRREVREFRGLPQVEVPRTVIAELRPYQREGLDFLAYVLGLGMGAILADDMGLGKTIQALAWLEHVRALDPAIGPALVVCPASVVHNWMREAERFTPGMRVLTLTSGEERHVLRKEIPNHDLVITNYALLRRDLEQWKAVPLAAAILDEAQNIKNPDAAVSRAVLQLDVRHRLALTGTPLENRALDLWSLMQFVNPGYLGSRASFVARYDRPEAPPHLRRLLAARLRPVMLRRLKSQVALDLPERIEERRDCEMARGQRQLYLAELARSRALVERIGTSSDGVHRNKIEILAALTRLRQVCCHPALVGGKASLGSGKFDALFELLEPLLAEGHKVLVFSQFVECLKLLAQEMTRREVRYHLLTGATTRREQVVAAFEGDPEPCVFLISLKAGGTGLNLTAASYVVLFDPWWNPAVEAQAIDRTHRIGQTRTVIAYRMLAQGTIEEMIWELQQRKAALVRDVLGEDGFARTLSRADLDYLLEDTPAE